MQTLNELNPNMTNRSTEDTLEEDVVSLWRIPHEYLRQSKKYFPWVSRNLSDSRQTEIDESKYKNFSQLVIDEAMWTYFF